MLWREKAISFPSSSVESDVSIFSDSDSSVANISGLDQAFSIFSSPLFASLKEKFIEKHRIPPSQPVFPTLERKMQYLDYLEHVGLHGLKDFFFTFMRSLRDKA